MSYLNNVGKTNDDIRKKTNVVRTNWNIKCGYCRVIESGNSPKIMRTADAISYAQGKGLDLVEIGFDKENHCVNAKVIDYGKYCYEQKRKEKAAKKAARENTPDLKSIQFSLTTDDADLERQLSHAKEFLTRGDRVKIAIRFRNRRESSNSVLSKSLMSKILSEFEGFAVLDSNPSVNGKEFSCIIRKA